MFSKDISILPRAMVYLIADLESTPKVKCIGELLLSLSTFMESQEPNPVFGRNEIMFLVKILFLLFANS